MAIKLSEFKSTKHTGLKIHSDGITFLFDIRIVGERSRKQWKANQAHTKADRLKTAYIALEAFRVDTEHKKTLTADANATVNDYWTRLKSVKGWKDGLVRNYDYYYNKHLIQLSKIKVKDIKPAHFTSLNVTLKDFAPATRKKAYEILKPLFDLAVEDEIIVKTPIKKSHIPVRKQLEEKKIITDAATKYNTLHLTIHQLFGSDDLVVIDEKRTIQCTHNPHHRALFLFGFYGRRLQEVLTLQWSDINFNSSEYTIRGTNSKVNTDMTFSLTSDVKDALLEFNATSGNVFNIKHTKDHYPKIRLVSGIEEFTFHWMRNLAVSALSSRGVDLTHLTAMLGHTDSSTLKKYLSLQRVASTIVTNDMSAKLLEARNDTTRL
jgi:integrase